MVVRGLRENLKEHCFKQIPAQKRYSVDLKDITNVQLLKEYTSKCRQHFYSYEMNLVLKNNKRLNVVDHNDKERVNHQRCDPAC